MIVTGQQPAVGGGPLYTLVKVAHAVALAKARGEPAYFWCASEDHDLGEAGHADVIQRDGTIRRFAGDLGALGNGRASLRFRPASRWWDGMLAHLDASLGAGLGADFLHAHAPTGEEGMGAWLVRLILVLFPGVQAAEGHTLRPRWRQALERALDAWPTLQLAQERDQLLASGAQDAFGPLNAPPLFRDLPTGRAALSLEQARNLLVDHLEELSPGAALRPILQQAALPCTAYVGGPGELAYHRFIVPLYAALGVAAPELVPRFSATLVPAWCARALERHSCAPDQLDRLRDPPPADEAPLRALEVAITAVRGVEGLAGSARRLERERKHLIRSLARRERQRHGLMAPGILRAYLAPRGARQERTMSLIQALWEHGPGIAGRLVQEATLAAPGEHRYVRL